MSRPLRIEYEGAWYHVMNRGRRSDRIFEDRDDYRMFMGLMEEITRVWDARISAFCLLPNHYHMVIQTPRGNISRCLRHLDGIYTQRFNRAHGLDGPLFRGRFKSILIDADSYLLQLVRYIHRNPMKAEIVDNLDQYPWSSHKGYMSKAREWDWLHKDMVFSLLTGEKRSRVTAYRRFMAEEDSKEIEQLIERKKWPVFLGSEQFAGWLRRKFFEQKQHPQVPGSSGLAPELEAIKKKVCSYYRVDDSELMKSRRGRFNEPRNMAIYLVRRLRKDGLRAIGSEFGLREYSSVSSIVQGFEKQFPKNRGLQKRYEVLRKALIIGQTET